MISTLGWCKLSVCSLYRIKYQKLSYIVLELFNQGIVSFRKVTGMNSETPESAYVAYGEQPMRHWLARSNTEVENSAAVEVWRSEV